MLNEKRNSGGFVTGLLTGSVVGGITALLFAPKSGKEFRQDISNKSSELYDDANHLLVKAKDKTSMMLSDASDKAGSMLHDGKEKVGSFVKEAGDYLTHGKEVAENEVSTVKEAVKSGVDSFNDERNKQKDKSKDHSNSSNINKSKNNY